MMQPRGVVTAARRIASSAVKRRLLRRAANQSPLPGLHILSYHHLPSPEIFRRHVAAVRSEASMADEERMLEVLDSTPSADRCEVVMTFDDGYSTLISNGGPHLAEALGIRPLLFCLAGILQIDGPRPVRLMPGELTDAEGVRSLIDAGWTVGSHTVSHWDCSQTEPADRLRDEVVGSKSIIEDALETRVRTFAYPFGHPRHASPEAADLVRQTYAAAFSGVRGMAQPVDRWFVRRDLVEEDWDETEVRGLLAGALRVAEKRTNGPS